MEVGGRGLQPTIGSCVLRARGGGKSRWRPSAAVGGGSGQLQPYTAGLQAAAAAALPAAPEASACAAALLQEAERGRDGPGSEGTKASHSRGSLHAPSAGRAEQLMGLQRGRG